jgi:hypothetical protein
MLVELGQERIKDGRIRVHFAISPEQISKYLIRVSDLQKNGDWMLLNETPLEEIERVGGRVSSLPNTSLERTRER